MGGRAEQDVPVVQWLTTRCKRRVPSAFTTCGSSPGGDRLKFQTTLFIYFLKLTVRWGRVDGTVRCGQGQDTCVNVFV